MLRHLKAGDARRVPWRNGRGVTEELALWPPGASFERGDFDWRIARAAVDEAGPFSRFPGFERVLVVLGGAGLALEHAAHAPPAWVAPLEPYRFAGEWATTAALPGGPVQDLSVLLRRGVVQAEVQVLRPGPPLAVSGGAGHLVLHLLSGTLRARESGGTAQAGAGESLWFRDPAGGLLLDLDAGASALLLRMAAPGAAR